MGAGETEPTSHDYGLFPRPELRFGVTYSTPRTRHISEHRHEFGELVIVCQGRGVHCTDGREHAVGPGDVFYLPIGRRHAYRDMEMLRLFSIGFDPDIYLRQIPELFAMPGAQALFGLDPVSRPSGEERDMPLCFHLGREEQVHVEGLLESLRQAYERIAQGSRAEVRAWFTLLAVYVVRRCSDPRVHVDSRGAPLARALAHIGAHYAESLDLDDLSEAACMSKSSLQRAFRRHMNCTPMDYVMTSRINRARELLLLTRMSVTAIAESVGFADSNHFSRRFRQSVGESPRTHRKRHQTSG